MSCIPTLVSDRLILRPFTLDDASPVQNLAGDKDISDMTLSVPHPYEDGMAEKWIGSHKENCQKGESVTCAITLKENDTLIGSMGIILNTRFNRGELGYWIGKEYWSNGYCTEAARLFMDYCFTELNLNKITAAYLTKNPASEQVMLKLGMSKEGVYRDHIIKCDVYEDVGAYGLLKRDYKK